MPTYLHPGVYVEEIPSGVKTIEGVATSTAAFIGVTERGPVSDPVLIFNYDTYTEKFGDLIDQGTSVFGDPMGNSVAAFFQNGGKKTYIVRLAPNAVAASLSLEDASSPTGELLKIEAANPGLWGEELIIKLARKGDTAPENEQFTLEVGFINELTESFEAEETYTNLRLDSEGASFIEDQVNSDTNKENSQLVTITVPSRSEYEARYSAELKGTSQSGDLSQTDPDDLVNGALELIVTLQRTSDDTDAAPRSRSVTVDFGESPSGSPASFEDVRALIEDALQAVDAQAGCTYDSSQDRLTITSGKSALDSAVSVSGSAAATLKFGTAHGGTEKSGLAFLTDKLIEAYDAGVAAQVDAIATSEGALGGVSGASNGDTPKTADYQSVLSRFEKIRDIRTICLPGQYMSVDGSGNSIIAAAISHAEKMKNRMVIVDPPPQFEMTSESQVGQLKLPTSTYTALYYPWVEINNPFYDAEFNPGVEVTILVPPSCFAAAMWAKIDEKRGVWKAPAGVETSLLGVSKLEFTAEDAEQDQLNPLGINCIRDLPNFPSVIWGARTLATKADPEWRYVPVRRTAIFIEQSIYDGIQWAVFEGNDEPLWSSLRANIDAFMEGLFRAGAFQGTKKSDAYFVRCGLGDTMTQADIDRGQVVVIVGFAPLKPAEFVIVRIQQKVNQQ